MRALFASGTRVGTIALRPLCFFVCFPPPPPPPPPPLCWRLPLLHIRSCVPISFCENHENAGTRKPVLGERISNVTAVKKWQLRKMALVRDGMVTVHVPWSVTCSCMHANASHKLTKIVFAFGENHLRLLLEVIEVCLIFT